MKSLRAIFAITLAGCGAGRTIHVPDSVVADPNRPERPVSAIRPYVVKMSDGQRTWQIEIPVNEGTGGFQAVVPLDLGEASIVPPPAPETEADREIKAGQPEKPASTEKPSTAPPGERPASAAPGDERPRSYLQTLAQVNALYRKRQYELALIQIIELERQYPDDERILEMKGTLYWRMKKPKLAREAWERVLAINPNNTQVAQALESLLSE